MSYVLSEGAMEKLIQDVADVRAGQAFFTQSVERMEDKLDKALEEHEDRIRALETYKDKQLGLMSLAAFLGAVVAWTFDHLGKMFK
jgi:DNA-binding NarL/FixJ family response regulator